MKCWACGKAIALTDMVDELPIVEALVHEQCYARETGHAPAVRLMLADYLRPSSRAA
jgi:hypothetical protein